MSRFVFHLVGACLAASPALAIDAADVVFTGEENGDEFGWGISVAGDVDDDGIPDVLVGAPTNAAVADFAGRAYLFRGPFGADRCASSAQARFSAEAFGDNLGVAVGGGDLDGDGTDDVVLGARGNDGAGIQAGRVYVFFGPVSGSHDAADADVVISGEEFDELGWRILVEDFNGDAIDDLLIGAPNALGAGSFSGEAALFYGPLAGNASIADADARFLGILDSEDIGEALGAGDLDGDGVHDVVLGGPRFPLGGTDTGRTYVFFSPVVGTVTVASADVRLVGEGQNDAFGASVCSGHDFDGDGAEDLAVGADQQFFTPGTGKVYLFRGPLEAGIRSAASAEAIVLGAAAGDEFGQTVAFASGGGPARLIIGAPFNEAGGSTAGRVYVFRAPLAGTVPASAADQTISGDPGFTVGHALAVADLDGDAREDLLVASPEPTVASPGHVFLFFGGDVVSVGAPGAVTPPSLVEPNPARGETWMSFTTEIAGHVIVDVFDARGRRVRRLADRTFAAARHRLAWDARDDAGAPTPAGVYIVRFLVAGRHEDHKLVRLE